MKKTSIILSAACLLLIAAQNSLRAGNDDASTVAKVTKDGVVPVPVVSGQLPKSSGETYYLSSAVENPNKKNLKKGTPLGAGVKKTTTQTPAVVTVVKKAKEPCPTKQSCKTTTAQSTRNKTASVQDDTDDEYGHTARIADPIQPVNRATFWVNHQIYRYILRPVSRTYDTVLPSPVRKGVYNVFDNLEYPDRFVNDLLQWKLKRAGQETGKFVVNSVGGIGGIVRVSDRIPALANVPRAETGQTFAKWGCDHGCYIVLPVIGPRSLRDTVGLAGDYALSPLLWLSIAFPAAAWLPAITTPDTARTLHEKLDTYDAVTSNTLDRYLAVRSAYIQNRQQALLK